MLALDESYEQNNIDEKYSLPLILCISAFLLSLQHRSTVKSKEKKEDEI